MIPRLEAGRPYAPHGDIPPWHARQEAAGEPLGRGDGRGKGDDRVFFARARAKELRERLVTKNIAAGPRSSTGSRERRVKPCHKVARFRLKAKVLNQIRENRDWPALFLHAGRRVLTVYSHSMVAGGFDETSYTTRFTPSTSLVMRVEMRLMMSKGTSAQSAVMPSSLSTSRSAATAW